MNHIQEVLSKVKNHPLFSNNFGKLIDVDTMSEKFMKKLKKEKNRDYGIIHMVKTGIKGMEIALDFNEENIITGLQFQYLAKVDGGLPSTAEECALIKTMHLMKMVKNNHPMVQMFKDLYISGGDEAFKTLGYASIASIYNHHKSENKVSECGIYEKGVMGNDSLHFGVMDFTNDKGKRFIEYSLIVDIMDEETGTRTEFALGA